MSLEIDGRHETPDELCQLLQEPHHNNRHDIWLWLCLYLYEKLELDRNTCNGTTMREVIARSLSRDRRLIKLINPMKDKFLVPDNRLSWISNNERQCHWLHPRINDLTGRILPRGLVHLTEQSRLIAMLDLWDIDIEAKAREIEELRDQWIRHTAQDSQFEWFTDKKDGIKRCICAWEWIQNNHLLSSSRQPPISNYKELLMFFDQAELGDNEQKAMIQQIMRRWNRQQLDVRNPDKKQFNVMLPITVIDQIDELANKYDLKRAKVVEILIQLESENSILIPEWLKAQRNP
jgi:hypothetical protein